MNILVTGYVPCWKLEGEDREGDGGDGWGD